MRKLVNIYTSHSNRDLAKSLFERFLSKNNEVKVFSDPRLDLVASKNDNIKSFCNLALSAMEYRPISPGQIRIHQSLENSGWDINNIQVPVNLGVPAFNDGQRILLTGDYGNGLNLMINGVQYVYIFATSYIYNPKESQYLINLDFFFYDVFGLGNMRLSPHSSLIRSNLTFFETALGSFSLIKRA